MKNTVTRLPYPAESRNRLWLPCLAAALLFAAGCRSSTTTLVQDRDTVYQLAPFLYILSGNYDGALTAAQFKVAGTLGIGTFEGLDGEAVLLDGVLYQVKGDSSVAIPEDTRRMPFGACTLFDSDLRRTMRHIASFEIFSKTLEADFADKQIFYAIRAEGLFTSIRVRSCDKQAKPYRPLAEATKQQHEYTYENVRGTLVGFWTPPFVPGSIGVPGFHLHFLSDDRKKGGHVLDFSADALSIALDPTPRLTVDFSTPVGVPLVERDIDRQVHDSERQRK
jgi:acetolactate decarboxylase